MPLLKLADGRTAVQGQVLVGFKPGISASARTDISQRITGSEARLVRAQTSEIELRDVGDGVSVDEAVRRYRADPRVAFAEPNVILPLAEIPNDPLVPYQWGLARVQAPQGWDVSHGSPTVRVAVIDTGIFDDGSTYRAPDRPPWSP